jgi:hypothetical protein
MHKLLHIAHDRARYAGGGARSQTILFSGNSAGGNRGCRHRGGTSAAMQAEPNKLAADAKNISRPPPPDASDEASAQPLIERMPSISTEI